MGGVVTRQLFSAWKGCVCLINKHAVQFLVVITVRQRQIGRRNFEFEKERVTIATEFEL